MFLLVRTRTASRVMAIALGVAVPLLLSASPALAVATDDGTYKGPSLGDGYTILLFVVAPIGGFLLIAGLALLPSTLSKPRYRPGKPWDHDARWFGGPADSEAATAATGSASTSRGGASAEW
jgi:hypothetical protein